MTDGNGNKLRLKVLTSLGFWETEVERWTYVRDLIYSIMDHFNYASNGYYELELEGNGEEPLKLNKPLESYPVRDGSVLIMTDLGVAV